MLSERNLKISLIEAFSTNLAAGLAELYFIAFALHRGVSVIESGFLSSLPLLFAALGPFVIHFKFKSFFHRFRNSKWVLVATFVQAFVLLAVALLSLDENLSPLVNFDLLLLLFTLYWLAHYASLPSWNAWVAEIVRFDHSQKYFSRRTMMVQLGIVAGLMLGGMLLHLKVGNLSTAVVFLLIFTISALLKLFSFYLFSLLPEAQSHYNLDLKKKWNLLKQQKSFFKVYSVFNFAIYLSAPYVAGYLLNVRKLNYFDFMLVTGGLFIGKIITSFILERRKQHGSAHKMYFIGGLLAAPLPALWPICHDIYSMVFIQILSGIGWAAWDVGISLIIYKHIRKEDKLEAVSLYNSVGLPLQVLGTAVGAALLKYVYDDNYSVMFVVAAAVRLLCILPLRNKELKN